MVGPATKKAAGVGSTDGPDMVSPTKRKTIPMLRTRIKSRNASRHSDAPGAVIFHWRSPRQVACFARGLMPECDHFGNPIPTADHSPEDASWWSEQTREQDDRRFKVEYLPSVNSCYAAVPWCVVDAKDDTIVSSYATEAEALDAARWENEQDQLDADPQYADWLAQVGDSLPPREYEDWDLLEMRCVPA
jgi:hypothetical protein